MPNLAAISQATTEINSGAESGIECFKSPKSDRVKNLPYPAPSENLPYWILFVLLLTDLSWNTKQIDNS